MKKYTQISILALIIIFLASCRTAKYSYQVAEDVNFEEYSTYAFLPDNDTSAFKVYNTEIVKDKTIQNIREEMNERGYSLDADNPDLLIKPHYMFERETETVYDPIYPSYDYYYPGLVITPWTTYYYSGWNTIPRIYGPSWREISYTESTIAIDVIDTETKKLVWRGWSEDRINPNTFSSNIERYVENIFKKYPVDD